MSLRLWRAPQPYFKLRFCSLIAFGPDCSHFPSAIPNMRETAPTSSAPSAKPAGAKADLNVDAMPDIIAVPKVSPWRRCSRCDGKRVSTRPHGPRPTSGVPDYRPECPYARRPTGAGIRSARAKVQQRMVLAGSHLRLGRNQQAIGAKEQDESHDACA